MIPEHWVARPADGTSYYLGVAASPHPPNVPAFAPSARGLLATRVDATTVGAPSDLYYLAATGPIVSGMTGHAGCEVTHEWVYADHAPTSMAGPRRSPGDFIAKATGTCERRDRTTRWCYFVAAPGFGPARETGIPGSGLYLIVASTPESPRAMSTLERLMRRVRFGDASARDFVRAVRAPQPI
jgi:hypothetical protein